MSPTEIETAARNRYNAINDTFWSQMEIMEYITDACMDLCRECPIIERVYTASTVVGTQSYEQPTNAIEIKRITYNGAKLSPIDFRQDDSITGFNQATTDQGTPCHYYVWNETIYLRPIPAAVGTLQIFTLNEPSAITTTSTLEIPTQFHNDITYYVLSQMAAKDSNYTMAKFYLDSWEKKKLDAKRWLQRRKRKDAFAVVKDEDSMNEGY